MDDCPAAVNGRGRAVGGYRWQCRIGGHRTSGVDNPLARFWPSSAKIASASLSKGSPVSGW